MVESSAIDTQPSYQRRERWTPAGQSALIESFLLNIPIPPVYLAEEDFGTYTVIDGKQRITTIAKFMRNKIRLTDLAKFKELEGAYFKDLPKDLENALKIRPYLRAVTLLKQSDPELKYEVFTRLNTGGEPLEPQEIRNALYRGGLNDLLFRLASTPFLRQQLKIKTLKEPTYLNMEDVEYVLRFFTIQEKWQNFEGDYRRSMDSFMADHKDADPKTCATYKKKYLSALARCSELWGDDAFKRYEAGVIRNQFLAGMYDAQMVAVSRLSATQFQRVITKKAAAINRVKALSSDERFDSSVRVATNNKSNVKYRIEKISDALIEICGK